MKKMLLHSCCGPCSTQVIDVLRNQFDIKVYYFNPNIDCLEEYNHRLEEQKRYCKEVGIDVLEEIYNPQEYYSLIKGHEQDKEGGERCSICFKLRMQKTAQKAKLLGFDIFATTLTVSPHKNSQVINAIGEEIQSKEKIEFYSGNFKKQDGYKKSIEFSKKYNLYRQNYCGCIYSKVERGLTCGSEKTKV